MTSFGLKLSGAKYRITRHYSAELQTTTQTLRATKYSIESTYSVFPCDLQVNRGKLALINDPFKCKKGTDRRSALVHSRKLAEHDNLTRAVTCRYRDRGQRWENLERAKNQSDCRIRNRVLLEKK